MPTTHSRLAYSESEDGSSWGSEYQEPIKLPRALRGYVRYVVVLHPVDCKPYSIGVKYVCNTEGAQGLLAYLMRNVNRKHKKHVHSWLCQSAVDGSHCELGEQCPNIHVTPQGYESRRCWLRPLKGARNSDEDTEGSEFSCPTPERVDSQASPVSSLCSSPHISRPISPSLSDNSLTQELRLGLNPLEMSHQVPCVVTTTHSAPAVRSCFPSPILSYGSCPKAITCVKVAYTENCKADLSTLLSQRTQELKPHWDSVQNHRQLSDSGAFWGMNAGVPMSAQPHSAPAVPVTHASTPEVATDDLLTQNRLRKERLRQTRAKLHNAVDWILSNDDPRKWTNFAMSYMTTA